MICYKEPFASSTDARKALRTKKKKVRPYRCGNCGRWHLTSDMSSNTQARRKGLLPLPEMLRTPRGKQ